MLTKQQIASVFGNLEALVPINDGILNAMHKRKIMFGPVLEKIGDIFLSSVRKETINEKKQKFYDD